MNLYSIGCSMGQPKRGVDKAPDIFYKKFLEEQILFESHHRYTDADFANLQNGLNKVYRDMTNKNKPNGNKPNNKQNNINIAIGGDHSIASATVANSLENHKDDLHVIWIDAHADINTIKTSPSGNFHGMPVASLMNLENTNIIRNFTQYLKPHQITYIAIRDLDEGEIEFLKEMKINAFWSKDVEELGIDNIIRKLDPITNKKKLHISFDVDAVDPEYMPSTGTAVGKGLTMTDALKLCDYFNSRKKDLVCVDIVEVNPTLGSAEDIEKTVGNAFELVKRIIA